MTTLVVGGGAMGSLFAGRLALAGEPVVLYSRPSTHLATITHQGLTVINRDGTSGAVALRVADSPAAVPPVDRVLVMVKAFATRDALTPLAGVLSRACPVLSLQNGLGNDDAMLAALPGRPVFLGTTSQGARRLAPGVVRHTGAGPTVVGALDRHGETTARELAELLTGSGIATAAAGDIRPWVWRKLAVNAAINGPTALAGVPNGWIATDPGLRDTARTLAGEIAVLARTRGIELDDIDATVISIAEATTENHSSMWQDLVARRPTEVGAIYEAAIALAAGEGLDLPVNRAVAALIHAREAAPEDTHGRD